MGSEKYRLAQKHVSAHWPGGTACHGARQTTRGRPSGTPRCWSLRCWISQARPVGLLRCNPVLRKEWTIHTRNLSRHSIALDGSDEGTGAGLGLIPGKSVRFRGRQEIRVPHMGWSQLEESKPSLLLADLPQDHKFYFVHSYKVVLENQIDELASSNYGGSFSSMVERERERNKPNVIPRRAMSLGGPYLTSGAAHDLTTCYSGPTDRPLRDNRLPIFCLFAPWAVASLNHPSMNRRHSPTHGTFGDLLQQSPPLPHHGKLRLPWTSRHDSIPGS